jgi:hypothetical protein
MQCRLKAQTGEMTAEQSALLAAEVASFFDELVAGSRVAVRAMTIARQVGHPVHDCFLPCARGAA